MPTECLVRYGAIPEVARCRINGAGHLLRGGRVVVRTHRGLQLGTVLSFEQDSSTAGDEAALPEIIRQADADDERRAAALVQSGIDDFEKWQRRIEQWDLDLQLIDLEWTLDEEKLILYVLNERGPECTKLALQAAAAGLGVIEVQPVESEGLKPLESGGCGSCGCG